MGTIFRFKHCAKSLNGTPVSIPSRIKVLEFDSLMQGESKILFIGGEAPVESCWLISLFNVPLWYVGVCSGLYLGSSCFVTLVGLLLLFYTERSTRTNCSISRKMINDEDGNCFYEQ